MQNNSRQYYSIDNRKLSPCENSLVNFNQYTDTWNAVFISRIKGRITESIVRQAIDCVQSRHPRLKSRLVGPDNNRRFEMDETLKLPLRVVEHGVKWQAVVREELNCKIDLTQSLMRATIIKPGNEDDTLYFITYIHHLIVDGLSGTKLHEELFTCMEMIAKDRQMEPSPCLKGLSSIQTLFPDSVKGVKGFFKKIQFLVNLQMKMFWYRPKSMKFEQFVPIEERRTGIIQRELDETLTEDLFKTCKKNKTTVQAALSASMLFAVGNEIGLGKADKMSLRCSTALDLRHGFRPPIDTKHLGLIASFYITVHKLRRDMSFWDLANDLRNKIWSVLRGKDLFIILSLFKQFVNFSLKHPEAGSAVAITNLGQIKILSDHGVFKLESISLAVSMAALCGVFYAAVSIFEGKMTINFTFSEPSTSYETAESIADRVTSCLSEACLQGDFKFTGK